MRSVRTEMKTGVIGFFSENSRVHDTIQMKGLTNGTKMALQLAPENKMD